MNNETNTTTTTSATQKMADARDYRKGRSTGKQLMGLSVISLSNGEELGKIHDVVYNAEQGRLVAFTVQRGGGLFSRGELFSLAVDDIHSVGEDAVTVDNAERIVAIQSTTEEFADSVGQAVLGKRLLTDGGKFLGNVDDVLIDRESRRVVAYEVSGGVWQDLMRGQTDVPVDHIITIGPDVVVVPESVRAAVEEPTGGLIGAAGAAKEKAAEAYDAAAEKAAQARTEAAEAIEQKEADYARGKTAGRDVLLDDGTPLVRDGQLITDDHIRAAIGAGKMHALAVAAGQTHAGEMANTVKEHVATATATVKEKAADLSEAAQEKHEDLLVGKTAGRAVYTDAGVMLVPAGRVLSEADVESARAAGKINDLTAAAGAGAFQSAREHVQETYESVAERVSPGSAASSNATEVRVTLSNASASGSTEVRVTPPAGAAATPPVVAVEQPPVTTATPSEPATLTATPSSDISENATLRGDEEDALLNDTPSSTASTSTTPTVPGSTVRAGDPAI